jgi:hypothetical protein
MDAQLGLGHRDVYVHLRSKRSADGPNASYTTRRALASWSVERAFQLESPLAGGDTLAMPFGPSRKTEGRPSGIHLFKLEAEDGTPIESPHVPQRGAELEPRRRYPAWPG